MARPEAAAPAGVQPAGVRPAARASTWRGPGARVAARAGAQLGTDWLLSGLLLVALAVALGGLNSVLSGIDWWIQSVVVAGVVFVVGAIVRSVARHRVWGTVAAGLSAFGVMTLVFAPGKALLWVIPTTGTFDDFGKLYQDGLDSIATQTIPAEAEPGVMYLVCLGVVAIAVAMDALAFAFRAPAFTGLPLLLMLLVPTFVIPGITDGLFFALTAAAWLAILLVRARPGGRRAAVGIGAAALVAALALPAVLPAPQASDTTANNNAGFAAGVNPIINLGDDLRRGDETLAITYTTTRGGGEYLRLAALDDFSGAAWTPTPSSLEPKNEVATIGPVPGLGPTIATAEVTSKVTVANILSNWLPVPYAPKTVTGLAGQWNWDADALSIRSSQSNARGQEYEVTSTEPTPSIEELTAAGTAVDAGLERYLQLPQGLPPVVANTAREVVGDAATNYEKAIRLQDYFTGGKFTYSESAPVKKGYDGSGAAVLAAFLEAKSGYCVHFASAMASMARTLGIPARVAVGFTPGSAVAVDGQDAPEYRVTTHDLHAWPELYFSGIGWVRFEPTPGRGVAPAFAPLTVDDPATPDVDESKPLPAPTATSTPTAAPTSTAAPTGGPVVADPTVGSSAGTAPVTPWSVLVPVLVVLALPFGVRFVRRQRRVIRLARGSALSGWDELRDTADDLGLKTDVGRTPRQLSADLDGHLDDTGAAALARLRASLEREAFAGVGAAPPVAVGASADLRQVLRSLRRDAGLARRLGATLLPRSLFAGWLPQAVAHEEP